MPDQIKFGTDGWRGLIADDFTFANLRRAAQGTAEYLLSRSSAPLAVVGYDCRFASEQFAQTVAEIFAANGVRSVVFDRPSPTQVASWTVVDLKATGGAVITASHNPYLFSGFKYKPETGSSAPTDVIVELEKRINAIADRESAGPNPELINTYDPRPSYFAQIGRMVDLKGIRESGMSIVHEVMHGSGYGYIAQLLEGGKTKVTELHADRNASFGGLNPEPIRPNIDSTLEFMQRGGHQLCICTDGDADRVGIIDEGGRFITQLQVYALLMQYLFDVRGMRGPVVKTVNMTTMADALAKEYRVDVFEVPVGFKNVAPKMMETGAVLGGEESGGYAVKGHIAERDGILIGLLFADMIIKKGKPLSQLLAELEARVGPHEYARHDFHMPRETYDKDRLKILDALGKGDPAQVAGVKVERVRKDDGVKYYLVNGSWVLLRASGTEPLVRVYAEAASRQAVAALLAGMEELAGLAGHTGV